MSQSKIERIDKLAKLANSSYLPQNRRAKYNRDYHLNEYIYDNDSSDKYHSIYLDDKNKKVYLSIRGTDTKDIRDLADDALVAFNKTKHTNRYKKSSAKVDELMNKYKDYQIEAISHSLGGAVGAELSRSKGVVSHSFNSGSGYIGLEDIAKGLTEKDLKKKINYYTTNEFDILSATTKLKPGKHVVINKKEHLPSHSIENFYVNSEIS